MSIPLFHPHQGGLHPFDQALYLVARQTPSQRDEGSGQQSRNAMAPGPARRDAKDDTSATV